MTEASKPLLQILANRVDGLRAGEAGMIEPCDEISGDGKQVGIATYPLSDCLFFLVDFCLGQVLREVVPGFDHQLGGASLVQRGVAGFL